MDWEVKARELANAIISWQALVDSKPVNEIPSVELLAAVGQAKDKMIDLSMEILFNG